jgi:hypothetical protein
VQEHKKQSHGGHYGRLIAMMVLSFIAMYILMYGMVNAFANVYMNVNQAYMAGLMAAPMCVIELVLMRAMYPDRRSMVSWLPAVSWPWRYLGCFFESRPRCQIDSFCDR